MAKRNQDSNSGPSQRQLRVGELIRRALAETVSRGDIHDPDLAHVSVTVGEVRATPDLRQAVVHVLPLGGMNAETVIEALNRNKYEPAPGSQILWGALWPPKIYLPRITPHRNVFADSR